jgi:hypothetical protein
MAPITVFIDGKEIPNLLAFFKQIVAELNFPKHTKNIQTFDSQINDLSWLEGATVRISVSNCKDFLIEEDMQVRRTILQILMSAMEDGHSKSPLRIIISKC